jgi:cytochrome c2
MLFSISGLCDVEEAGQRIIDKYVCTSCHTIGKESGGMVGPDLNQVTIRRTDEWLRKWLENPAAVKPGTFMPKFDWEAGEIEAVIAYMKQLVVPVDAGALLKESGGGIKAGRVLIEAYQCYACHEVAEQPGRALYPDLTTVKGRRDAAWEKTWLTDPQQVTPGTFMPNFHLSEEAIRAIVDYLYK